MSAWLSPAQMGARTVGVTVGPSPVTVGGYEYEFFPGGAFDWMAWAQAYLAPSITSDPDLLLSAVDGLMVASEQPVNGESVLMVNTRELHPDAMLLEWVRDGEPVYRDLNGRAAFFVAVQPQVAGDTPVPSVPALPPVSLSGVGLNTTLWGLAIIAAAIAFFLGGSSRARRKPQRARPRRKRSGAGNARRRL